MELAQKQMHRSMERNREPRNPHLLDQLIYTKGVKTIQWIKDILFNKWCWENRTTTHKRMKLDYFPTPYTKIQSKWIKDLNVRPETITILEENIDSVLFDTGLSNMFLDMSPQVWETKAKISK